MLERRADEKKSEEMRTSEIVSVILFEHGEGCSFDVLMLILFAVRVQIACNSTFVRADLQSPIHNI